MVGPEELEEIKKKIRSKSEEIDGLVQKGLGELNSGCTMGKTALLIGAGFSKPMGMPLASEVNGELFDWLTPEKQRQLRLSWQSQRANFDSATLDWFGLKIEEVGRNYETLVGVMQERLLEPGLSATQRTTVNFLISKISELTELLIVNRHLNNPIYQDAAALRYGGMKWLAKLQKPIWIFSLNHDVCVELISRALGIEIRSPFFPSEMLEVRSLSGYVNSFNFLSNEDLQGGRYNFLEAGREGINLLKLHGSFDMFWYRDQRDYVELRMPVASTHECIRALKELQENTTDMFLGKKLPTTGEITFKDASGKTQFLRKTVLSGTMKFDPRTQFNAPREFFELFKRKVDDFETLVVVGYGFLDAHINAVIAKWISDGGDRQLVVINPDVSTAFSGRVLAAVPAESGRIVFIPADAVFGLWIYSVFPFLSKEGEGLRAWEMKGGDL